MSKGEFVLDSFRSWSVSEVQTMKETKLKPVQTSDKTAWRLNVPANLSETGKRRQLFFSTKQEAATKAEQLKARKANFGILGSSLSAQQIAESGEAYKMLDGIGVTLLDAVRAYIADHTQRNQSVTLDELFRQQIARKPRLDSYHKDWKGTLRLFPDTSVMVSDIKTADIEAVVAASPDGAKRAHLTRIGTAMNFGIKRGWLKINPVDAIDKPEAGDGEVEILSPATVKTLLEDALANERDLIPYIVLTTFCGVRPEKEMERIEWANVLEDKVFLRASQTKTGTAREIPLSDNAKAWLRAYDDAGGTREGAVVGYTSRQLQLRRQKNFKVAGYVTGKGVGRIPQDAARHSFCSYFYAKCDSLKAAMEASGHEQSKVFFKHYRNHVTASQTEDFWSIFPPTQAGNVVPFVAAA